MKQEITLNSLQLGKTARVIKIDSSSSIHRRLLDIGLVPGSLVTACLISPFNDPVAYKIKNALIAIRTCDSEKIVVELL